MKARLIFLFVILFSLSAQAQNFWEPLDGPYGGSYINFFMSGSYIITYTPNYIIRSSDNGLTWESITPDIKNFHIDRIFKTASEKLFLLTRGTSPVRYQMYLSTDDGDSWNYLNDNYPSFAQYVYITDNFLYYTTGNGNQTILRKRAIDDTVTTQIDISNFYFIDEIYIDKNDNIYLFSAKTIYISTDGGGEFRTIRSDIFSYIHKFDVDENLSYELYKDSNTVIYYTLNKGISWDSIYTGKTFFDWSIKSPSEVYFYTYDTTGAYLWLIENADSNKITNIAHSKTESYIVDSFWFTDTTTFVKWKSGYFSAKDKYLKELIPIKFTAEYIDLLKCGTNEMICGSYSSNHLYHSVGNKIDPLYNALMSSGDAFISSKDYVWVTNIGIGPLDTWFSTDNGKTFNDDIVFNYSPVSMAENSKQELYSISWQARLCQSSDQINWKIINNYSNYLYGKKIYINNQDELIFVAPFDTLGIQKYDPITYNQLFDKQIVENGKFVDFIISKDDSYYFLTDSLLYRSADEGSTFTVVLDAGSVRKLRDLLEMNNMLFIATNQGVMTSVDKGATWTDVNTGLNSFDCRSIGKTGDNTLYLGLAGDVVYRSVRYTSVEENIAQDEIVCTPNPATDFIEIDIPRWAPLAKWSPSEHINIINVYGQTVSTPVCSADTPASGGQRIDVSGLAPGMYFVRIGDRVGKFVKL